MKKPSLTYPQYAEVHSKLKVLFERFRSGKMELNTSKARDLIKMADTCMEKKKPFGVLEAVSIPRISFKTIENINGHPHTTDLAKLVAYYQSNFGTKGIRGKAS